MYGCVCVCVCVYEIHMKCAATLYLGVSSVVTRLTTHCYVWMDGCVRERERERDPYQVCGNGILRSFKCSRKTHDPLLCKLASFFVVRRVFYVCDSVTILVKKK